MINEIDKVAVLAELSADVCELNHGPDTNSDDYEAHNILTQPIGEINIEADEDLPNIMIPLCKECAEGLYDDDWLLMYCLDCHSSQWLYKPEAKLQYGKYNIIWFKGCPKCSDKPREIYYN